MRAFLILAALAVAGIAGGCQTQPVKHYPIQGEVISVDLPNEMIRVKHGEILGLMPAMTMDYKVADVKHIAKLNPGDTISADLVVGENVGHLEKIVLLPKVVPPSAPAASQVK